ncbi:hypothetical protein Nepgr_030072 [Nepenthes gracilis]|uniref:Uncharacterized protein n=1 Tax=Nepenthes gracilis TaxID=150966 RepID=A0AAD3Y5Q1_NEPGR|nr:hypothetical protein Nepgr_030072 [Nepenthes gracilis]
MSSRRNSDAHQVVKNSSLDVAAAEFCNPSSADPGASKAIKHVPLASNQLSPKEKIDCAVFPLPSSGLPDGLKDFSLISEVSVLHQADCCSSMETEGSKPMQKICALALKSGVSEVGHGASPSHPLDCVHSVTDKKLRPDSDSGSDGSATGFKVEASALPDQFSEEVERFVDG